MLYDVMRIVVALLFLAAILAAAIVGQVPTMLAVFYLMASAVAFIAYARDKSAAAENQWRTPESRLHLYSLAGGWPGALLAQTMLRHKSRKQSFQAVFFTTILLNLGVLALYAVPGAFGMLSHLADLVR